MEDCDDARSRSALLGRLDTMSGRIPVRKQGRVGNAAEWKLLFSVIHPTIQTIQTMRGYAAIERNACVLPRLPGHAIMILALRHSYHACYGTSGVALPYRDAESCYSLLQIRKMRKRADPAPDQVRRNATP